MIYRQFLKRLLDLALSLIAITVLSPILLLIALLVRWRMGPPVLFRQIRPGYHGRPFTILKFRTMATKRNNSGELLPDSERLTRFGHLLRSSSLDELPELFNVLKGEMSLVGPRPLLIEYLKLYSPEQMRRNEVKPGITGWAQINGRNNITWDEKFALDLWYVDHHSFKLDLKILFTTFFTVLRRDGINQKGQATVEFFQGYDKE